MPQNPAMTCADLRPGDIMLKLNDGSIINKVIKAAQSWTADPVFANMTHAGMMVDAHQIAEASGNGAAKNDLLTTNYLCEYLVFRSTSIAYAGGLGECANMFCPTDAGGAPTPLFSYSKLGAIGSLICTKAGLTPKQLDDFMQRSFVDQNVSTFCSEFVMFCCRIVDWQMSLMNQANNANPLSPVNPAFYTPANPSPAALGKKLLAEAAFQLVGYMPPRSR